MTNCARSDEINKTSVLLVTLWDNANFGNRLQAIALKKMLEDHNCAVECLASDRLSARVRGKRLIVEALGMVGLPRYKNVEMDRRRRVALQGSTAHIFNSVVGMAYGYKAPRKDYRKYDAVITGSDQVWHQWTDWQDELPYFYLEFVDSSKRISYAASFGYDELPADDIETHIVGLEGMASISCRERTGCEIVKKLTGKDATLVADPTLCVGRSYWETLERRPDWASEGCYKLLFCLGSPDAARQEAATSMKDGDAPIIDLRDYGTPEVWDIGIGEFIWLVHHASHVYTDSFHCTVFSILFGTPFTVFRRSQEGFEFMWDRIATLLDLTGLQCCEYGKDAGCIADDQMMRLANERISAEAARSCAWLASALNNARRS